MIRIFMIGFSSNKGGVESYINNLTEQLDSSEFEVMLEMPEMIIDGKVWNRPKNRHNFIKYFLFWKKFFSENHFDVLYLNTCDIVSIDDLMFAKSAGIPIRIIHSHSTGNQQAIGRQLSLFHRLMEKYNRKNLDKYATHLFACSKEAGEWMFDGRSFEIIKNGVCLSSFVFSDHSRIDLRKRYGFNNAKIVGVIGRISSVKNPLFAIRIIEELFKIESHMYAVFIGDGELKSQAEAAVKEASLGNVVSFIGAIDNVNEWLSAIDVLLMPSLFEGIPFVLVEAQAAGLPCVVSNSVSPEANITGCLHYVGLDEPISVWVHSILDAFNENRQDNNSLLIRSGYSIEDTANKVCDIIRSEIC